MELLATGRALYFTVRATNTDKKHTTVSCVLDTYDVTPPSGRMEPAHLVTSHPHKLMTSLIVIEDAELVEEQYVALGVGRGFFGDQVFPWKLFKLEQQPINVEGDGDMAYFAAGRVGRLTSSPLTSSTAKYDYDCARTCLDIGDGCVSFDYDYTTQMCHTQWTIEGMQADLVLSSGFYNFEKLGGGHSAYFAYEGMYMYM